TGGMGAYSPVPIVTPDELAAMHDIMERAAVATAREYDNDYRGVLYGGFMLTPEGPKIIEFNARFGDPVYDLVRGEDGEPVALKGREFTGLTYTCPVRQDL
ncbi:hypothetical protein NE553_15540, partial [Eggerthella lenta]|nr:hypothetical protein [Eggerthella lenta]